MYLYRLVHPLSKKTLMISSHMLIDTYCTGRVGVAPYSQTVQSRDQICHVQGGRGLEGALPAAEGGERQDPQ